MLTVLMVCSEKDQLIQDLIAIIGTVPRQLKFIKSYAEEINGQQTSGYKTAFHQLLAGYARRTIASFLQQHTNFLKSLDPPERLKMINSTFLVLIGERGPMSIPPAYLDTSIVYMHDDKTYDMVTPLAAKAVVQAFRNEGEIETLADYRDVLDTTKSADHRSRPFERIIFAKFIKSGNTQVRTVRCNGTDERLYQMNVEDVVVLPKGYFIPAGQVKSPTLYIPEDRSQPL